MREVSSPVETVGEAAFFYSVAIGVALVFVMILADRWGK